MGYRSEVAVAIKREFYPMLIEGIPENTESVKSLISEAEVHKGEDGFLIHWDHIKWYYTTVEKFEQSLKAIDPDHWIMFEIGEDLEDNKVIGHWWENPFNLSISRSLYMDIG